MENEKNISGISENLSDSIKEESLIKDKKDPQFLFNKRIAISVSECEELEQLGFSAHHLKDISIEIARYLMVNGATMMYGGDMRNGGYTEIFRDLSHQYRHLGDKEFRFVNYFPFPNSKAITIDVKADFMSKQVHPEIINIPSHLGNIDTEKNYEPFKEVRDRFIFSECFADMRIKMAQNSDARIVLGGKQKNFLGYYPGIVEEAYQTLRANKPIYLIGGFGGAAKSIIKIIQGEVPPQMTNDFQFDTDFLKEFKSYVSDKSTIKLDYVYLVDFFKEYTVDAISKENGLSKEENLILFESTNIHEIVFLIMKGLKNISTNQ
ncbi:MAG: hypothetical protein R6V72_08490 [Cyclobacterium sp.]|uniref:hypothetical protein n=1 Tax=Cyclobacterium sp. TaxID=1966343 RepID=UPI003970CB7B